MENLILLAVVLVIYALVFIPGMRRRREAQNMRERLAPGDEVVLDSGIHGFITEVEDTIVWVEVAEGTELKVQKSNLSFIVSGDGGDDADDED